MLLMQSKNLLFEPLTAAHADELFSILVTPSVLAFIDPTENSANSRRPQGGVRQPSERTREFS